MASQDSGEFRWNAVCLHGALQSRDVFDPLIEFFAEQFPESFGRAISVDLPGHGTASDVRSRYTAEVLARFVLDAVPQEIFSRPTIIVAQSFSGVAAMALHKIRREIVGVVMLDTPLCNFSARESVLLLIKRYRDDMKRYFWIPDMLRDYFGYVIDRGFLHRIDYHDCIVDGDIPVAMITGSEKKITAAIENDGTNGDATADPKVVTGTFDEMSALGRQFPGRVRLIRSAACFGDQDVAILERKNATNLKIYALAGQGHNILAHQSVGLIGSTVGKFAVKCLKQALTDSTPLAT